MQIYVLCVVCHPTGRCGKGLPVHAATTHVKAEGRSVEFLVYLGLKHHEGGVQNEANNVFTSKPGKRIWASRGY